MGKLFHSDGIIFGEGLIEAYNLESKIAKYPRVIISPNVLSAISSQSSRMHAKQDSDGLYYLNYLETDLTSTFTPGEHFKETMQDWVKKARVTIDSNVKHFSENGDMAKLSKWHWYSRHC